jgi:hypothetical protein
MSSSLSAYSSHPENDQEMEFALRRREMTKMYEARRKMKRVYSGSGSSSGSSGSSSDGADGTNKDNDYDNNGDIDVTDMTKEDISIVCEELWVDFKTWINGRTNVCDCAEKVCLYLSRNWVALLCGALFMIAFRWYIGAGKDACAYGFGWGAVSLICEVMRHLGEILLAALTMICGFCCATLPVIACACIYEAVNGEIGDEKEKKE